MKPSVWNIKEMLNIPSTSGGMKTSKGPGTSDYSSLTDSQFLLGSQMWPDNSQGVSQETAGQSRGSQEMKELTVSSSYSSKPFLFGSDGKFPSFTSGKSVGMLDKFEEEKRKAKEKNEREILTNGILHLQESLENTRETLLNRFDGSNDNTRNVLLERMDHFSKTVEDYLNSVKKGITCQFETLQSQTQTETADREAKITQATKELSSNMLNIQRDLEALKSDKSKEHGMLEKILSQLCSLISIHKQTAEPGSVRMIDSEVQTSPGLFERFCVMSVEKHHENKMTCNGPVIHPENPTEQNQCPLTTPQKTQNRNAHALPVPRQQPPATEGVSLDTSQEFWWYKHFAATRTSNSLVDAQSTASTEDHGRQYEDRCLEPEKATFVRENRLGTDVTDRMQASKRCQKAINYRGKKRALVLPHRQSETKKGAAGCEQKDRVPLSSLDNRKITNKSVEDSHSRLQKQACGAPVSRCVTKRQRNPFSLWSEDTDRYQMVVEHKMVTCENVVPEPKDSVPEREVDLWHLFDFTNDSD